ncbi:HAD-like domain-containing protein [Annulohypoxylon truncatum]|uniref:HAD-like domain-containing protein n=1 Tax=Annulohypoxylon truncatum TaxID=327061 RepID=UPI002008C24C|nr:HAD-like domain-containing protein [Annulohypoxylon truncatum]KAI1211844.1 HAD-like domain-containing protein [Annulohypoxylon truncatum]
MAAKTSPRFPPIRACIFDMDGLLINSEDIITLSINQLLKQYERPTLPRSIRAQLMGVPNSTNGDLFHDWAKLPISREQFARESSERMRLNFRDCEPLAGAEKLLEDLSHARNASGNGIKLSLASGTKTHSYELKVSRPETKRLLSFFESDRRILGDDPRVRGRGKPAPDIYSVALQSLNSLLDPGERNIGANECLVFEDSVVGVEAARRAGMRVVWVPHPDMAVEYQGKEKDVLAGRARIDSIEDEWQLGKIDDGWAESIPSLGHFNYEKYGISIPP